MLEEGDEAGGDRDHLQRRDVHELDRRGGDLDELGHVAGDDAVGEEVAVLVEQAVGLGDDVLLLLVGGHVDDLVRDAAVHDAAVGRLDEAELVDVRVEAERGDEADVRAFRGLDRADAAVVGGVDVADFEAGAVAREAAGAEGREAALVGEGRERVRLVHELRELGAPEEVLDDGGEGLGVDEARGRELPRAGVDAHALLDEALGAGEADAALVLEKLAGGADAAVAEVVDVVDLGAAGLDVEEPAEGFDDVAARLVEDAELRVDAPLEVELLVELVAADEAEVVVARVEEEALELLLGVRGRRGVAGAEAAVDVFEGLGLAVGRVDEEGLQEDALVPGDVDDVDVREAGLRHLAQHGLGDGLVAAREDGLRVDVDDVVLEVEELEGVGVEVAELQDLVVGLDLLGGRGVEDDLVERVVEVQDLLVRAEAEGAQEGRDVDFPPPAPAVEVDPHDIGRVELDLDPGAAVGDDADGVEGLAVGVSAPL